MQGILLALTLFGCCQGNRLGPPLSACRNMTPIGHQQEPQTTESPFTFTLNATTYRPGDVIEVFLDSSGGWFMEGVLIQMRTSESDCTFDTPAVGTFSTVGIDSFLEEFNCFNVGASALRHYSHQHIYNRTFLWIAPERSVGNVHLRATIARNKETFWENVRSEVIMAVGDNPKEACWAEKTMFTFV